jgi:hypothetical protein
MTVTSRTGTGSDSGDILGKYHSKSEIALIWLISHNVGPLFSIYIGTCSKGGRYGHPYHGENKYANCCSYRDCIGVQLKPSDYYEEMSDMIDEVRLGGEPRPSRAVALAVAYEAAASVALVLLRWTEYWENFPIPEGRPRTITQFMSHYRHALSEGKVRTNCICVRDVLSILF